MQTDVYILRFDHEQTCYQSLFYPQISHTYLSLAYIYSTESIS